MQRGPCFCLSCLLPYVAKSRQYPVLTLVSLPSAPPSADQPASLSHRFILCTPVFCRSALRLSSPAVSPKLTLRCPHCRISRYSLHFLVDVSLYSVHYFPPPLFPRFQLDIKPGIHKDLRSSPTCERNVVQSQLQPFLSHLQRSEDRQFYMKISRTVL
jgi:hypothetical protein